MSARQLTTKAFAKINLGFEVLGRRTDGLHEVATILQTIDLADSLSFAPSGRVSLACDGMEVNPDNLILQAAKLLAGEAGVWSGCAIGCHKGIPLSAGLAGGSADAAATLRSLRKLWDLPIDDDTLHELAGQLGADVPFCLKGGTALATGTGRTLERLPEAPSPWIVLVPLSAEDPAKTAHMYQRLGDSHWTDGSMVRRQVAAIRGGSLEYSQIRSAFTDLARETWTDAGRALDLFEAKGALAASVSGAGPSVFGLYGSLEDAERASTTMASGGLLARVCRFVGPLNLRTDPAG